MQKVIKKYFQDPTKVDASEINENIYNKILKEYALLSFKFCLEIEKCNFLFIEFAWI